MIPAYRFLVRSSDYERWISARKSGVSATSVARAATKSGFNEVLETWGMPVTDNPYMQFGRYAEPILMEYAHREYGILPNDWLIRGNVPWHLATPDGLSLDHTVIAEAKTTGKGFDRGVPIQYRRQMNWQMHVTGTQSCLLLWNTRVPMGTDGQFYLDSFEPHTEVIYRDDAMIANLVRVANDLRESLGIAADVG